MKRGAYLVNNARGAICDTDAIVTCAYLYLGDLLKTPISYPPSVHAYASRYEGDVWPVQPAPPDHPWRRHMPNLAMLPHLLGASLDAQVPHLALAVLRSPLLAIRSSLVIMHALDSSIASPHVAVQVGVFDTKCCDQIDDRDSI